VRRELVERQTDADRRIAVVEGFFETENVAVEEDVAHGRAELQVERAVDVREVVEREEDAVLRARGLVLRDLQATDRRDERRGPPRARGRRWGSRRVRMGDRETGSQDRKAVRWSLVSFALYSRVILPRQGSSACCCILTRRASGGSASEPALARRKICEIFESPLHAGLQAEGPVAGVSG